MNEEELKEIASQLSNPHGSVGLRVAEVMHKTNISMSLGAFCFFGYMDSCGPDDVMSQAVDNVAQLGVIPVIAAGGIGPPSHDVPAVRF